MEGRGREEPTIWRAQSAKTIGITPGCGPAQAKVLSPVKGQEKEGRVQKGQERQQKTDNKGMGEVKY